MFEDKTFETILQGLLDRIPSGVDKLEGSFIYDALAPVAVELAQAYINLDNILQIGFPQQSYGEYLDMHAELVGLKRKEATKATGTVQVTGNVGTIIPAGFMFAVPQLGTQPAVLFATVTQAVIPETGIIDIEVEATEPGLQGNVPANTITYMPQVLQGITSVTNPLPTSGGSEEEDDESLRARILEATQALPLSGSLADYRVWAKQVDGVGEAFVVPEWNGPGTVKVIIIDSNGEPANSALIEAVQNYIAPMDGSGLRPIGAIVTVVAPVLKIIDYSLHVVPEPDISVDTIIDRIKANLHDYYREIGVGGIVKYSKVFAIIANTDGVSDFTDLTINGAADNIILAADEYPSTGTVTNI